MGQDNPIERSPGTLWEDETCDFNMLDVLASLRGPHERPGQLVKSYIWYPDAVAIDAVFPPGVRLSITEICAYYPHHVRWQDVMLRLSHNDYRGPEILAIQACFRGEPQDHMSPSAMNQIQRDAVQRLLPAFKTTGYQGRGCTDTHTDHLKAGAYLEKKLKGYIVPTFDDLLRGLTSLPHGEEARALTQCLMWYHDVRKSFTPSLELNVLHTQALFNCLRHPLEPSASSNPNRLALEQWHERGMQTIDVGALKGNDQRELSRTDAMNEFSKSRAVFNIRTDPIYLKMCVKIPIRHILIFPFLALHGVVADAYEMGITTAQQRQVRRKDVKLALSPKKERADAQQCSSKRAYGAETDDDLPNRQARTPKRIRVLSNVAEPEALHTPKQPTISPNTPRAFSIRLPSSKSGVSSIKLEKDASRPDSVYSRR